MPYDVNVRWSWGSGGHRFVNVHRFTVRERPDIDAEVRAFIPRMVDRYGFDCGRLYLPLTPILLSIVVTPIGERENLTTEAYAPVVNAAIEAKRAQLAAREAAS